MKGKAENNGVTKCDVRVPALCLPAEASANGKILTKLTFSRGIVMQMTGESGGEWDRDCMAVRRARGESRVSRCDARARETSLSENINTRRRSVASIRANEKRRHRFSLSSSSPRRPPACTPPLPDRPGRYVMSPVTSPRKRRSRRGGEREIRFTRIKNVIH